MFNSSKGSAKRTTLLTTYLERKRKLMDLALIFGRSTAASAASQIPSHSTSSPFTTSLISLHQFALHLLAICSVAVTHACATQRARNDSPHKSCFPPVHIRRIFGQQSSTSSANPSRGWTLQARLLDRLGLLPCCH